MTRFRSVEWNLKLSAKLMKKILHEYEAQLYPIPTEAPWGTVLSENSQSCFHTRINRRLMQKPHEIGHDHDILLTDWRLSRLQ